MFRNSTTLWSLGMQVPNLDDLILGTEFLTSANRFSDRKLSSHNILTSGATLQLHPWLKCFIYSLPLEVSAFYPSAVMT